MGVSFYMDVHVPRPITDGLRQRGVDVLTAQEDGMADEEDAMLLTRATELGRVVFTMDIDFFNESAKLQTAGVHFSGVIYAHQLSVTVGDCIRDLELSAKAAEPEDFADQIERLPL